ncbi:MAG TPA: SDR family oxidoreductase [Pirellulaceae bacterium]
MKNHYIMLTGSTGLLGQYLVRDLMRDGHRLAVLVRGSKGKSAAERVERMMQFWEREAGTDLPRPICLPGDITQPMLGLNDHWRRWVTRNVATMFHCAASLTFHEHNGEPRRTNVEGTRNVVDFCEAHQIDDMQYVSTAYVCGRRHDLVREDELDVGQQFRNDYEKSKFLAEQLVREHSGFRRLTIYRPVVITGDSVTGYTATYHGTYLYMKLASVLASNMEPDADGNRHIPIRWGATGEERRNITPVDWNSRIICQLYQNPDAHGRTYHLAPAQPMSMRSVIDYAARFYGITGIEFHGYGDNPSFKLNELERWIWSNVKIYGSYDFMDPSFDMSNLNRYAPEPPSPVIDYAMAERFMRYADQDRWGKRKPPPLERPPIEAASYLREIQEAAPSWDSSSTITTLGLEVVGPGGGPFQLHLRNDHLADFDLGLPATGEADSIVTIDSRGLAAVRARHGTSPTALQELFQTA